MASFSNSFFFVLLRALQPLIGGLVGRKDVVLRLIICTRFADFLDGFGQKNYIFQQIHRRGRNERINLTGAGYRFNGSEINLKKFSFWAV